VVVSGVFDWIVKDEQLMEMIDAEFEMYQHHLREQNGRAKLWVVQEHVALVGAAGDATGPGVLHVERGCTSGRELEVDQLPVLHEVRDGGRFYGVQTYRHQH